MHAAAVPAVVPESKVVAQLPSPTSVRGSSANRTRVTSLLDIQSPIRVVVQPPLRDLSSGREPHAGKLLRVGDELVQRTDPARAADHPAVQPDRHHLRILLRLVVEHVETVLEVLQKLPLSARAVRLPEPEVVDIGGIRNHQVPLTFDAYEIGNVVVVSIAIVEKAA